MLSTEKRPSPAAHHTFMPPAGAPCRRQSPPRLRSRSSRRACLHELERPSEVMVDGSDPEPGRPERRLEVREWTGGGRDEEEDEEHQGELNQEVERRHGATPGRKPLGLRHEVGEEPERE